MSILIQLNDAITRAEDKVCPWFQAQFQKVRPPVYASVDIRNGGYKISAIDTNLYPAGFNNIFPRDLQVASGIFQKYIEKHFGNIKKILILPEEHTRNTPYLQNLYCIQRMLRQADYEVQIGLVSQEMRKDSIDLEIGFSEPLHIHRAIRKGNRLVTANFDPDLIIVNNDFSKGPPEEIQNIEQLMEPPIEGGWHFRKKSRHFEILHQLIDEFAQIIDIDPWLLQVETKLVNQMDVQQSEDRERLANVVEEMLEKTKSAFEARGIKQKPYVFLKDNAGTYGIAVMTAHSADEIRNMNSKARKKMAAGKSRTQVREILVQEGVPTKVMVGDCPAEPVIYLGGEEVIGGFFRKHCEKDEEGSLNAKGMLFSLMTFASPLDSADEKGAHRDDLSLKVYGTLGKIAYLALGYEIQELLK